MDKLTAKQKRFCDEYLVCLNATQAAMKAGYSKTSARQIAQENMSKPYIQEYIKKRMKEKDKQLIADSNEVMQYLTAVMRREKTEHIVVTVKESKAVWNKGEDGKMRKDVVNKEVPRIVEIPAMLKDSNKAAELLGRAHGLYTDRLEGDVDMTLNISVDYGE